MPRWSGGIATRAGLLPAAAGWKRGRLGRSPAPCGALLDGLEEDQASALERALGSSLLLVLGPPGTGKTLTRARTVHALLHSGERVLLLAPTHAAVDAALAWIALVARERDVPAAALLRQGRHGPLWPGERLEGAHREGIAAAVADLEMRAERLGRGRWKWAWGVAEVLGAARVERLWRQGVRSVAVLIPYRAHVDCLRMAVAARMPDLERAGGLVGTVHSAQGSEHDAVIVDLVATGDDPGRFLDER